MKKALYGLKQAPRAWYSKIIGFLFQSGYFLAPANFSLFVKASSGRLVIILVYVDVLIITSENNEKIQRIRGNLSICLQIKEFGELKHMFSLEVDKTNEQLFLCQKKYVKDLLKKFGMLECKSISTPMEVNTK